MAKYNLTVSDTKFNIDQIYTSNRNLIHFYLDKIEDSVSSENEIFYIKIEGINYNLLESMSEIDGQWYVDDDEGIKKYSFYDIIDVKSLNLFQHVANSIITLPINWNASYRSITGNLVIRTCKEDSFEKRKNIGVVGMKHSGSTLLWNIIRLACNKLSVLNKDNENDPSKLQLYKCHSISKAMEKNCHIITTIRDIRDTAISGFLRFYFQKSINEYKNMEEEIMKYGLTVFIEYMHENLNLFYDSLQSDDVIIFKYEDYKQQPVNYIQNIFTKIGICPNEYFVQSVINEAERMKDNDSLHKNLDRYHFSNEENPDKLLTKDHNTSGGKTKKYKDFFSPFQNEIILKDKRIRTFLEKYGYMD